MTTPDSSLQDIAHRQYEEGFVTEIEMETFPKGLSEEVVRMISAKKDEVSGFTTNCAPTIFKKMQDSTL